MVRGSKPRTYPEDIVQLACDLYQSGMTVREIATVFPKGYKVQLVLERHLPERRRAIKREQSGERNDAWKGDRAGYSAAHLRLIVAKGPAASHRCIDCGAQAVDWSYQGGCPKEQRDERKGSPYSTDPDRYVPRCRPCHIQQDRTRRPDGRFAPRGGDAA